MDIERKDLAKKRRARRMTFAALGLLAAGVMTYGVSKLEPAKKETYTAVITGPDAKRAVAEMVATLYDESLDQFLLHRWNQRLGVFHQDYSTANTRFPMVAR